jgi:hypothetical protein
MRKVKTDYEWAIKSEKLMYGEKELTTVDLLSIMERARDTVIDINWPEGVPAMPKDNPRFWFEDTDQRVKELVKKEKVPVTKVVKLQKHNTVTSDTEHLFTGYEADTTKTQSITQEQA